MNDINKIGFDCLPREIILGELLFKNSQVSTICNFSRTNKSYNNLIMMFTSLWNRKLSYDVLDVLTFRDFIGVYRKINTQINMMVKLDSIANFLGFSINVFFDDKHYDSKDVIKCLKGFTIARLDDSCFKSQKKKLFETMEKDAKSFVSFQGRFILSIALLYPYFMAGCIDCFSRRFVIEPEGDNLFSGYATGYGRDWLDNVINCGRIKGYDEVYRLGKLFGFTMCVIVAVLFMCWIEVLISS